MHINDSGGLFWFVKTRLVLNWIADLSWTVYIYTNTQKTYILFFSNYIAWTGLAFMTSIIYIYINIFGFVFY